MHISFAVLVECYMKQMRIGPSHACIYRIHDIWSKTISSKRRLVECDIWLIRRYADYAFGRLRQLVKNLSNYVEIKSKFGRKLIYTEKFFFITLRVLISPIYFHASNSISISVFRKLKTLICHFLGSPIASEK